MSWNRHFVTSLFLLSAYQVAWAQNLCEVNEAVVSNCYEAKAGQVSAITSPVSCSSTGKEKWRLFWGDEFSDASKFDSKWTFETGGWGWFNGELQHYTERPENHVVQNGRLNIIARQEKFTRDGFSNDYTSAKVTSRGPGFIYGRYEVRTRLPAGPRLWPAAWLLAREGHYGTGDKFWPQNGEIDIMEYNIFGADKVFSVVHTMTNNHRIGTQEPYVSTVPDINEVFHTYAMEWSPRDIKFFIDGRHTGTYENQGKGFEQWPFDKPFYMIMNLAIQGDGPEINPKSFPATVEVDYVRIYAPMDKAFCEPLAAVTNVPNYVK